MSCFSDKIFLKKFAKHHTKFFIFPYTMFTVLHLLNAISSG